MSVLTDQVRYAVTEYWRARLVLVFSLFIPLIWLGVIGALAGNEVLEGTGGLRVMQFATPVAVSMAALYAALPTTAISLAQARETGVLKRLRGTPAPVWTYLVGRTLGASLFALISVGAMLVVGVLAYDVRIVGPTVAATVVTLAAAVTCYVVVGLAIAAVVRGGSTAQAVSIALVIVLSFVSGLFSGFGTPLPDIVNRVADVLPVRPVTQALQDQFDPFRTGSGWDLSALLVLLGWTAVAGVVAARGLRAPHGERPLTRWARHTGTTGTSPAPRPAPTREGAAAGRPTTVSMTVDQAVAGLRATWRDPGAVFFTILMPVGLYAFLSAITPSQTMPSGVPVSTHLSASMTAWGVGVSAFMNLPESVTLARDRGVLKRLRGTPLTSTQYLAGRIVTTLVVTTLLALLVLGLGTVALDLTLTPGGVLLAWALTVLGALSLAALGFLLATAVPNGRTFGAVALVVLLPLAFVSDVLITGGPAWMGTVGSLFPLLHLQHALVGALDPAGASVAWSDVAVIAAWLVGAGAAAVRWFRWRPRDQ